MKKLAHIRRLLVVAVVVLVGLAGFGIGRVSAPQRSPDQTEIAPDMTPLPVEVANLPDLTPPPATPTPTPASSPTPAPSASGESKPAAETYVLKKDGNGLVVLKNEVVVAAFSAEWAQLPEQVRLQLETGIMFESLDDIESYLEDYES
ncbi:MAG: hypothetical protein ACOYIR_02750 [Christensenellales bacterium]